MDTSTHPEAGALGPSALPTTDPPGAPMPVEGRAGYGVDSPKMLLVLGGLSTLKLR